MAINPLQPAINYMGMLPQIDLGRSFEELGATLEHRQDMLRKQEEARRAEEAKKAFADDLNAARTAGTQEAWLGMIAKYPQFREAFSEVRKGVGEERVKNDFFSGFEISNALENKRPEVAAQKLQTIIAAKKQAGEPTGLYESVLSRIEAGDIDVAQASVNEILAITDPERYEKTVKAKLTLPKSVAEADEAIAKAKTAQATAKTAEEKAKADLELAKATAAKAKVEAQYTEQGIKADLSAKAAQLGLTKAQTNSALAQTRKLGIETKAAALQLEALRATGGVDPDKTFAAEEKIRKEWQGRSKVYNELQGTYKNIQSSSAAQTGAGDIALITSFMKMLDPGSVVRETEFATARDTAGLYAQLQNVLQKAKDGQILKPEQRNQYVSLSKKYLDAAQEKAKQEKEDLGLVVKNYRLNPENVFGKERSGQRNVVVEY